MGYIILNLKKKFWDRGERERERKKEGGGTGGGGEEELLVEEFQIINAEEMTKLESQHFAIPSIITNASIDHHGS